MVGTVGVVLMAVAAVVMYQNGHDAQNGMLLASGPAGAALIIAFLGSD